MKATQVIHPTVCLEQGKEKLDKEKEFKIS